MKRIIFIFSLIFLSNLLFAQKPKNIIEFHQLLSDDQFTMFADAFHTQEKRNTIRKKYITITDVKNGYLKLDYTGSAQDDQAYSFEVVLFKKKDGNYVVGLSETHCISSCEGVVKFLEYTNGKWNDVTKKVFTPPSDDEIKKYIHAEDAEYDFYAFALPRYGKTMQLFAVSGNTYSEKSIKFDWNGEKFVRIN